MLKFPTIVKSESASNKIVSWTFGTFEEKAAMLAAHDRGEIDINDYWSIGDTCKMDLSAVSWEDSDGVTRSIDAQTIEMTIMDTGAQSGYKFSDGRPVHFVVGMKNCLSNSFPYNLTSTNAGSWASSYAENTITNDAFCRVLPSGYNLIFKAFWVLTASEYNSDTTTKNSDIFSFFAQKEIFGTTGQSREIEADSLTQIDWYKTSSNRTKRRPTGATTTSTCVWLLRSPRSNYDNQVLCVNTSGSATYTATNTERFISCFGCI